jgi:aryl-alcohol dehydrogenase-like predicted oxidoreductase
VNALSTRPLGRSNTQVSRLSLGSWRTYERIPRADAEVVLAHALACGITFFDDARYNAASPDAPMPSGWSEVLFGELLRAVEAPRERVVVANKLWWEFWPDEDAVAELRGSLERMRFDRVDLIYACPLPDAVSVATCVQQIGRVLDAGLARAWGICNWSAEQLAQAAVDCERAGIPAPCAAQLPYSLGRTAWVDSPEMDAALEACGASLVASHGLAGGILSGKYADGRAGAGRMSQDELDRDRYRDALRIAAALAPVARRLGTTPAALAIAFTLVHPRTATTLVGATSPAQLDELLGAVELADRLTADDLEELRAL